jgi:hypothetical protein
MKKNIYTRFLLVALAIGSMSNAAFSQAVGDYGSAGVGPANFGVASSWIVCTTAGSWASPGVASIPSATTNVWVRTGHTINVEASAKLCKDATIDGTLTCSNAVGTPAYLRLYGSTFTVNGTVPISGLSLEMYSTALTVTGTGSINLCRARPTLANSTFTADANMTFNYVGAAFYANNKDVVTFTVNANKTVNTAVASYLSPTASTTADPGTPGD